MDRIEIVDEIKLVMANQFGVGLEELTEQTNFQIDLHADSLDAVEIIMMSEDKFDISIPDKDANDIFTIGALSDYIFKVLEE